MNSWALIRAMSLYAELGEMHLNDPRNLIVVDNKDIDKLIKFLLEHKCAKLGKFSVERSKWQECIKEGRL